MSNPTAVDVHEADWPVVPGYLSAGRLVDRRQQGYITRLGGAAVLCFFFSRLYSSNVLLCHDGSVVAVKRPMYDLKIFILLYFNPATDASITVYAAAGGASAFWLSLSTCFFDTQ